MTPKKEPKFHFEMDGLKYGGRFLSILEQSQLQVEVDRVTNGRFSEWMKTTETSVTALMIQTAYHLEKVICVWPVGMEPIDFVNSDDYNLVLKYWEAYQVASERFRGNDDRKEGGNVASGEQTP